MRGQGPCVSAIQRPDFSFLKWEVGGMAKVAIEWREKPTMNPRNTAQLRALIERRTAEYLWGQRHFVVPRLCSKVFGDGRTLLGLSPIMFRPNYFVVRIDSGWSTSSWDQGPAKQPCEWLDDVYDAIEDQWGEWPWAKAYGLRYSDDDQADNNSRIDFADGCSWWEMSWPRLRRPGALR